GRVVIDAEACAASEDGVVGEEDAAGVLAQVLELEARMLAIPQPVARDLDVAEAPLQQDGPLPAAEAVLADDDDARRAKARAGLDRPGHEDALVPRPDGAPLHDD